MNKFQIPWPWIALSHGPGLVIGRFNCLLTLSILHCTNDNIYENKESAMKIGKWGWCKQCNKQLIKIKRSRQSRWNMIQKRYRKKWQNHTRRESLNN